MDNSTCSDSYGTNIALKCKQILQFQHIKRKDEKLSTRWKLVYIVIRYYLGNIEVKKLRPEIDRPHSDSDNEDRREFNKMCIKQGLFLALHFIHIYVSAL
jgi:hypothetical protein